MEGCNENLVFTRPNVIREIHEGYLEAGADIIETNTFGGTPLVLDEYGIERDDTLKLISEGEHLHSSDPRFRAEFDQLAYRLGVEQGVERMVSGEW